MHYEHVENNVPDIPVRITWWDVRRMPEKFHCKNHIHDEIEVIYSVEGSECVEIDQEKIFLDEGDIIVINKRVPHTVTISPQGVQYLVQFREEKIRYDEFEHMNRYLPVVMADSEKKYEYISHNNPVSREIIRYINCMREEVRKKGDNYNLFVKGYMSLLLATMYRNNILDDVSKAYDNNAIKRIWPAIEYIDKNYEKNITLRELSDILNLNSSYFCRIFKRATNTTPTEYINFVRIWKAENLLTTTKHSVLEISMAVGFSSVSYFNKIFRKMKSTTPTNYRKILYEKNKVM